MFYLLLIIWAKIEVEKLKVTAKAERHEGL